MKKSFMFIYCFASLGVIALTVFGNNSLNKTNNVFLNFLFFIPMLAISLLMMYFVTKNDNKANIFDILAPYCLFLVTGIPMAILPMFVSGLANSSLYLSNVFAYFVTYLFASGMALRKTTKSKRLYIIITTISNFFYWFGVGGSVINCFFKVIKFTGPVFV